METRTSAFLRQRVAELGFSLVDLARESDSTREYSRRLLAGMSTPSSEKINSLVMALGLTKQQEDELREMATVDRADHDRRRRENRSENYPDLPGMPSRKVKA